MNETVTMKLFLRNVRLALMNRRNAEKWAQVIELKGILIFVSVCFVSGDMIENDTNM
ncbi:hypothetical protein [Stenotrophomonas maltophilia]|uniref:hypothetical protein n=1 Tax=Stenotrophomonas maltophilia TaxID=40324 RepID=UPI002E7923AF|nr:hypothetical protein [Stenotrophomonas maltophilia]